MAAVPAFRRPRLPLRKRRVCLARHVRLGLDACAVAQGKLRARVRDPLLARAPAGHEDHAWTVARADEDVLRLRRAVDEVPRAKPPLLALDQQHALACDDDEVLLVRLTVIEAARLSRLQHAERESNLPEGRRAFAFEGAG